MGLALDYHLSHFFIMSLSTIFLCDLSFLAVCEVPKIPNSNFAEGGTLEDGDSVLIRCNIGFSYDQMARFRVSCDQGELLPTTVIPDTCHCKYTMHNHSQQIIF